MSYSIHAKYKSKQFFFRCCFFFSALFYLSHSACHFISRRLGLGGLWHMDESILLLHKYTFTASFKNTYYMSNFFDNFSKKKCCVLLKNLRDIVWIDNMIKKPSRTTHRILAWWFIPFSFAPKISRLVIVITSFSIFLHANMRRHSEMRGIINGMIC